MNLSKTMFAKHSSYKSTKLSNEIKESILAKKIDHKIKYFALVEYIKYGKVISDVLAVNTKIGEVEVALRIIEGCAPLVSPNLIANWGCGYSYTFSNNTGYYKHQDNILSEIKPNGSQIFIPVIKAYNYIDLVDWSKDNQLKYLTKYKVDIYNSCTYLSEFVTYLRVEPKIELMVKAGIGKRFKEYKNVKNFKLTPTKIDTMNEYNLTVNQMKSIERRKLTPEDYLLIQELKKIFKNSYDFKIRETLKPLELIEPLIEPNIKRIRKNIDKYKDLYVDSVKLACRLIKCGVNLNIENYLLYTGKNLKIEHDNLFEMEQLVVEDYIREKERREAEQEKAKQEEALREGEVKNKALKKISTKYNKLIGDTDNDIKFNVLGSLQEYLETGEALHHCVFKLHYYDKVISKESLIINAMVNDQITETLEIDLKNKKIVQCRGKNNLDSKYHKQILELANKNIIGVL